MFGFKKNKTIFFVFFSIFLFLVFLFLIKNKVIALDSCSDNFCIKAGDIESIVGTGTSTNFQNRSAGGQTATGQSESDNFKDFSGILYWLYQTPPIVSNVQLNNQNDITLVENSTVSISAIATVYDAQGCKTISSVTAKIYRSGVSGGKDCTEDTNNCYAVVSCTQDSGSCTGIYDDDATYTCTINMQYHADPTDTGTPWASEYWRAWIKATDETGLTGENYSPENAPDVLSLLALDVTSPINYGNLNPGDKNDPLDKITTVTATGNCSLDVNLYGTNMSSGGNSISVNKQKYALSSGTPYADGTSLSETAQEAELNCPKTTNSSSPQIKNIWWGIEIPSPQPAGNYSGTNTFEAVKNELPWP